MLKNIVQKIFCLSFIAALVIGLSGTTVMAGKCKQECIRQFDGFSDTKKQACLKECKKAHSGKKREGKHKKHQDK